MKLPHKWQTEYASLSEYTLVRERDLRGMLPQYVSVTDCYGAYVSGVVAVLGGQPPSSAVDESARDLIPDIFDSLYNARRLILETQLAVAYPLLRRAFESQSLLAAFMLDGELEKRWSSGKEIKNAEVRRLLDSHSLGESGEQLRETYRFLSKASHPTRDLVPTRFLGRGNEAVLGAVGVPSLAFVADYCLHHLGIWFWLAATISYNYRRILAATSEDFGLHYSKIANEAKSAASWLVEQRNRLVEEDRGG